MIASMSSRLRLGQPWYSQVTERHVMKLAKIPEDSISPGGVRHTTLEVKLPRYLLAEFNTHCVISRNSASSRARPLPKTLASIRDEPHMPRWGKAGKGMQDHGELPAPTEHLAKFAVCCRACHEQGEDVSSDVLAAMDAACSAMDAAEQKIAQRLQEAMDSDDFECVAAALDSVPLIRRLSRGEQSMIEVLDDLWIEARAAMARSVMIYDFLGVHKQKPNRLIEPWMWQTIVASATDWANFLNLRCHSATEPDFQRTACAIGEAMLASTPTPLLFGEWHTPLICDDERGLPWDLKRRLSVARCARVSYLTHDGKRSHEADEALYTRLTSMGHYSPTEHVARPSQNGEPRGKFYGWTQHRQTLTNQHDHYEPDPESPAKRYGVLR